VPPGVNPIAFKKNIIMMMMIIIIIIIRAQGGWER
jgi:hypothetical protein